MNKELVLNEDVKIIDDSYFNNYGGSKYKDTYLDYTTSPQEIFESLYSHGIDFEKILDAGCASGELVRDLRKLGFKAYGIENNKEILKKCIIPKFCVHMDIRNVDEIRPDSFDIVYLNSLMYLHPSEVIGVLRKIYKITKKAVFLCNPFLDEIYFFEDPYRKFLATRNWWEMQFYRSGFRKITDKIYKKF